MFPRQSVIAWKVCLAVLHAFAISSTVLRLWDRLRCRKLWWDDYVAALAMVLDFAYAILFWFRFQTRRLTHPMHEQELKVVRLFWLHTLFYFTIVWSSRVSLSLSLARIFPPGMRVRRWLLCLTFSFIGAYLVSCILTGITCSGGQNWRKLQLGFRLCKTGPGSLYVSGLTAVSFDFIADILLVTCPLVLLWRVNLPKVDRIMVLVAFSASLLTSLAAIVFCIFWYGGLNLGPHRAMLMAVTAQIQAAMSLIVCNLLIISMFIWRFFRPDPDRHLYHDRDPGSEQSGGQTVELPERSQGFHVDFTPISQSRPQVQTYSLRTSISGPGLTLTSTFESAVRRVGIKNTPFKLPKSSTLETRSSP